MPTILLLNARYLKITVLSIKIMINFAENIITYTRVVLWKY